MKWAVCSYRGVLLALYDTYTEAHEWVGKQEDTSQFYIRRDGDEQGGEGCTHTGQ